MSYRGIAQFKCDGCKVVESDDIELPSDNVRPVTPASWLRVEATEQQADLEVMTIRHYCPNCAPMIESYLRGRLQ